MPALSIQVDQIIAASPDVVWAYRLDFSHLPEYNPDVVDLQQVRPANADGTGAQYRFDLVHDGARHPILLTVTTSEPGRRVGIELAGELPAREELTIEACSPSSGLEPSPTKPTTAMGLRSGSGSGSGSGSAPNDTPASSVARHSRVTLALTLLVPDSWPQAVHGSLLQRAAAQAEAELGTMATLLADHGGRAGDGS